jgi:hypothetical protein
VENVVVMKVVFKNVHSKKTKQSPFLKMYPTLLQVRVTTVEPYVTACVSWFPRAMRLSAGTWR